MRKFVSLTLAALLWACAGEIPSSEEPTRAAPLEQPTQEQSVPAQELVSPSEQPTAKTEDSALKLMSSAFEQEEPIPAAFSCDGENISPRLTWSNPPDGTRSFALIMDDPDAPAGTWVHWVLFNLPGEARSLPEAVPPDPTLNNGAMHGSNSWETLGYGGPCPPGGEHRYFFKLYALDSLPDLSAGATKDQVLAAMQGHILAQTELMGTYSR